MPTWFCSRATFERLADSSAGFSEMGPGTPEDLDFFYRHLRAGGTLSKVSVPLVIYRAHEQQTSRGVSADKIWDLRVEELETALLQRLDSFSIWSAGRDGKRLYRSLCAESRAKVVAFLDVDEKKIKLGDYFEKETRVRVPIVHWTLAADARYQPTIICVKEGLHAGFE